MKSLQKYKSLISIGAFLIVASSSSILVTSCGTTPVTNAANADALLITSVNTGMTTWAQYVNAGKATQSQVDAVKNAYDTYYNAQLIVKAALETSITTTNANAADSASASAAVTNAETALLNLLNLYIKK